MLQSKGACILSQGLRQNRTLKSLQISRNEIDNKGLEEISRALMQNTNIPITKLNICN